MELFDQKDVAFYDKRFLPFFDGSRKEAVEPFYEFIFLNTSNTVDRTSLYIIDKVIYVNGIFRDFLQKHSDIVKTKGDKHFRGSFVIKSNPMLNKIEYNAISKR